MKEIVVKNRCVWVSAILGAITFMCIYGLNVLNPQYIDWLYSGGDLTQHYLGWVSYRNSRWFFPIGLMDQLTYPFRSSIIFSDSIPLMAVFFKCFSWVLPETFQYFGLWGIMTFALNGAFSAKILQKYLKKNWQIIFGSCFFILSFQVLARMYGHTALAAHWVILFAIYMLVYHDRNTFKTKMKLWALLGFLCSAIHIYFLLMCGLLLVGFCVIDLMDSSDMAIGKRLMRSIAFIVAFVGTALITVFLLGGFEAGISMENVGLGYYSLNINGFFDSQDIGLLTKGLPRGPGQYEGFSYLGFGMILMLGITGFEMLFRGTPKSLKQMSHLGKGMVVAFLLAIIVALSPIITCGSRILLTLRLPQLLLEIWRVFRASGRMAWVCIYLYLHFVQIIGLFQLRKRELLYVPH